MGAKTSETGQMDETNASRYAIPRGVTRSTRRTFWVLYQKVQWIQTRLISGRGLFFGCRMCRIKWARDNDSEIFFQPASKPKFVRKREGA